MHMARLRLGFGCQMICVLLILSDSSQCDFICSILWLYFAMGSCSTNNSLHMAPVYQMLGGESGLRTSTSHTVTSLDDLPTTSQTVVSGGEDEFLQPLPS